MTADLASLSLPSRENGDTEAQTMQDIYIGVSKVVRSLKNKGISTIFDLCFFFKLHYLSPFQAIEVANRYVTTLEPVSLRTLTTLDAVNDGLAVFGITWELLAFLLMYHATRLIPGAHAAGTKMELDNAIHGLVYWYIVRNFLLMCVERMDMTIPGLSTTDAVAGGLSSYDKIHAFALQQITAMTAACTKAGLRIPDLSKWFFQRRELSSDGSESGSGSDAGSGDEPQGRRSRVLGRELEGEQPDEDGDNSDDGSQDEDVDNSDEEGDEDAEAANASTEANSALLDTSDDEEEQQPERKKSRGGRSGGESSSSSSSRKHADRRGDGTRR